MQRMPKVLKAICFLFAHIQPLLTNNTMEEEKVPCRRGFLESPPPTRQAQPAGFKSNINSTTTSPIPIPFLSGSRNSPVQPCPSKNQQ